MRNTIATLSLLLVATAVRADDGAADLFYRALWLEQTSSGAAEAEKLYRSILADHEESPEAPRALAALIRIGTAQGRDVDDLVSLLERRYPKAKQAHQVARGAARRTSFDPQERAGDTPVERQVKGLYGKLLTGEIGDEGEAFLADLGPVAHPMLRQLLRASEYAPVERAARILLLQRASVALDQVEAALRDEGVLFHGAILEQVAVADREFPVRFVRVLGELQAKAAPRLRAALTRLVAKLTLPPGESAAVAWKVLARALSDADPEVRSKASRPAFENYSDVPTSYLMAHLARLEAGDDALGDVEFDLLYHCAEREGYAERALKALIALPKIPKSRASEWDAPAAVQLTRALLARLESGKTTLKEAEGYLRTCTRTSGRAAALIFVAAIERGDRELSWRASWGMTDRKNNDQVSFADQLGPIAAELLPIALEASFDADPGRREAGAAALYVSGFGASHLDALLAMAKKHPGRGLPTMIVTQQQYVKSIGPGGALRLVPHCGDGKQVGQLLDSSLKAFPGPADDDRVALFGALLDRVDPDWGSIKRLAGADPKYADLVALWLLDGKGEAFGFKVAGGSARRGAGPGLLSYVHVMVALQREPARDRLYAVVADERYEIGSTALRIASQDGSERGVKALVAALESPWADVRVQAIKRMRGRGAPSGDALVAFLGRKEFEDDEESQAWRALAVCGAERHAAFCAERLAGKPEEFARYIWEAYRSVAPNAATEAALTAVREGGPNYRNAALHVLGKTSDGRRIQVFRDILRGTTEGSVLTVLGYVREQYLIELGEETLRHLRSPDDSIRATATQAVERLKFYAEARKAFAPK